MSPSPSLRDPGAVVLISTYELGHQPLAIASATGFLARAGYEPGTCDVSVEALDPAQIARARFVGISVPMHTALRLGVHVALRVRATCPGCHICFFGLYAALNAAHLFREHGADSILSGEIEGPLVALLDALDSGRDPSAPGVATPGRAAGPHLERLDFAVPRRTTLPPLERYAQLERAGEQSLAGYVEASRGCKHRCLHCPIPPVYDGRFFVVPEHVVMADVRQQVAAGARHVTFGDPDFLNGPAHARKVVRALHAEFPTVTYDFTAKVEHVLAHAQLLPELAAAGCIFVVTAVESWSDEVLANLEKGHTRADIFEAIERLRACGIAPRPSLVAFTPWTSIDDYVEMFDLVEAACLVDHVDPVQYTIRLLVPPGSLLLSREPIRAHLSSWPAAADLQANAWMPTNAEAPFAHPWSHPDERMDELHRVVSRRVETGARDGEDAGSTFDALRCLAIRARDGDARPPRPTSPRDAARAKPPRLTEPWFC